MKRARRSFSDESKHPRLLFQRGFELRTVTTDLHSSSPYVNIWCRCEGRGGLAATESGPRRVPQAARGPARRTASSRAVASSAGTTHTKSPKKPGHLGEAGRRGRRV